MSEFDQFIATVGSGAKGLAQTTLKDFVTQAQDDTRAFLAQSKQQLQDWTTQLALGQLSKLEFEVLVGGLKDLATLRALTQAGIAAADAQRFRDALITLVIDAAFKTFLP